MLGSSEATGLRWRRASLLDQYTAVSCSISPMKWSIIAPHVAVDLCILVVVAVGTRRLSLCPLAGARVYDRVFHLCLSARQTLQAGWRPLRVCTSGSVAARRPIVTWCRRDAGQFSAGCVRDGSLVGRHLIDDATPNIGGVSLANFILCRRED